MTKQEALQRLCKLASHIASQEFNSLKASDCFCGLNVLSKDHSFQFDQEVLQFIEEAVTQRLANHKKGVL